MTGGATDAKRLPSRVTIVEDNDGDIYLLRMALSQAGVTAAPAIFRDGADAVTHFRQVLATEAPLLPELILVDLNLPRLDGYKLVEMLRADRAFDHVPLVMLSSSRSPSDIARAGQFDNCIYFRKPSELSAFLALGSKAVEFWQGTTILAATA